MGLTRLRFDLGTGSCQCGHSDNDHSHILVDAPCLQCDCWAYIFDGYATHFPLRPEILFNWGQAVGMGLVDPVRLRPPD